MDAAETFALTRYLPRVIMPLDTGDKMKSKEFSKDREFGVILEKIHSDIKIIIEDLTTVKNKLNATFDEVGRQKEDIYIIRTDIAEIKTLLKSHDKRLSALEAVR